MIIPIDITGTVLHTDRLTLRPWSEEDLSDFFEYASVPGVGEMAGWRHHKSMEESKQILDSFMAGKNIFALVYKETGKVIGSIGLHESWADTSPDYKNLRQVEIGYVLSKDYWGHGLMPEAVKEVIRYCFEHCGLDAVTIEHYASNRQSRRVIEKCGLHYVQTRSQYVRQLDQTVDSLGYILLNPGHIH